MTAAMRDLSRSDLRSWLSSLTHELFRVRSMRALFGSVFADVLVGVLRELELYVSSSSDEDELRRYRIGSFVAQLASIYFVFVDSLPITKKQLYFS